MKVRALRDFVRAFQKGREVVSQVVKSGDEFTPSPVEMEAAIAQGFKVNTVHGLEAKVPMAGLLNHCEPVDDEAEEAFAKFFAGRGK